MAYAMPGFEKQLTDRQMADVLTFIRRAWGNGAPAVGSDAVHTSRAAPPATPH